VTADELRAGLRGGVAFLTRLPLESGEQEWLRFQEFPAAFPLVGYLVGALAALPFLLLGGVAAAFAYPVALVGVVGIAHLDGVADLGDAAVVHDTADRREILKDTTTGVGAIVAVGLVLVGLALAGLALAELPLVVAVGLVVASEVGAKLGMATVACLGSAAHEGLGAGFTRNTGPPLLAGPAVAALPAVVAGRSLAALVAVAAGPLVAVAVLRWADRHLGGVNGDIFGAVNELGRVVALHAGVFTWTRF
jgi:adenosylcobinamide-GDP ribazoletransferase